VNIYVSNLAPAVTEEDVRQLFEQHGQVMSVRLPKDRMTGRHNGYGFIVMSGIVESESAISGLNRKVFMGRELVVKESFTRTNGIPGRIRHNKRVRY